MLIERSEKNPILKPNKSQSWEAAAVLNGCPVKKGNTIYLLYRAIASPRPHTLTRTPLQVSAIGIARSKDGMHFEDRKKFFAPEHAWEQFGCEDPKVTQCNGKYYIFYTAIARYPLRADGIRVGLAVSKDLETVQEKHLVTPFNAKAMALFPEKIQGKFYAVLTVHTDRPPAKICVASFDREEDIWSGNYWDDWYKNFSAKGGSASGGKKYALPLQRRPHDHIEVGAPPIKTRAGWLLVYSYIRNYFSPQRRFSVEAVLLDLKNPLKIIARTEDPLFTPEAYYERVGRVRNVVFPSGAMIQKGLVYLYYGAADTVCCLATMRLSSLLHALRL